jgi:hypothetical protein
MDAKVSITCHCTCPQSDRILSRMNTLHILVTCSFKINLMITFHLRPPVKLLLLHVPHTVPTISQSRRPSQIFDKHSECSQKGVVGSFPHIYRSINRCWFSSTAYYHLRNYPPYPKARVFFCIVSRTMPWIQYGLLHPWYTLNRNASKSYLMYFAIQVSSNDLRY